ncbi:hypothetical protein CENSYa_1650 [Cenarchaeum symbiosum A]|uniref:Uncharacterized protein n=1 Tax=Cenarchaeum symbiosum (strain A) TaxID=414004 RepID=A0RY51_CENSY|nr:hypothetical protein CENSYa_1650 [Cenarchaeum symbiosum A]
MDWRRPDRKQRPGIPLGEEGLLMVRDRREQHNQDQSRAVRDIVKDGRLGEVLSERGRPWGDNR